MSILMLLSLLAAGLVAGALTTIAGLGGGILLIAVLSQFWPPAMVLGATAPALFVGNASRAMLLRREVDWRMAGRFSLAAIPCAFAASLVAAALPAAWLRRGIAGLLVAFVADELWHGRRASRDATTVSPWLATVAGAIAGTVSGLTGGAGFVATPLLDRLGLAPARLVATSAVCMALVHLSKGIGFGVGAVLTTALVPLALALAVGVMAGNALGVRVLRGMPEKLFRRCLLGALAIAALQLIVVSLESAAH